MTSFTTSHGIGFEELAEYFHLPINQVSKELGVCATVLKKICRRNGIPRWPHRKIKSLDRMIKALETTVANTPEELDRINREIEEMKAKKFSILKNPNSLGETHKYKISKSSKKGKDSKRAPYPSSDHGFRSDNDEDEESDYSPPNDEITSTSTPSYSDIAVTVSEIMSSLKARRQKDENTVTTSEKILPLSVTKSNSTEQITTTTMAPIGSIPINSVPFTSSISSAALNIMGNSASVNNNNNINIHNNNNNNSSIYRNNTLVPFRFDTITLHTPTVVIEQSTQQLPDIHIPPLVNHSAYNKPHLPVLEPDFNFMNLRKF